jgi:hypothetical protein
MRKTKHAVSPKQYTHKNKKTSRKGGLFAVRGTLEHVRSGIPGT